MAEKEKEETSTLDILLAPFVAFFDWLTHGPHDEDYKKSIAYTWFSLSSWITYIGSWGISRGLTLVLLLFTLLTVAQSLMPEYLRLVGGWLLIGFPVYGPIAGLLAFWSAWRWYISSLYIFQNTNPILLEVRMPADVMKSPRAMEQALIQFQLGSGETTFIDRFWKGGTRPFLSLEIASFGGDVHFYIWTRSGLRNLVEAALYSQYPEVEIVQVDDYASKFQYDPAVHDTFVTAYKYRESSAFPIKTYVDYELDEDPKEEFKVDPISQVIEALSAIGPGKQAWTQLVFEMDKKEGDPPWAKMVENEVNKIRQAMTLKGDATDPGARFPRPAWRQNEQLRSMERNLGKFPFHVGIRTIYIAPMGQKSGADINLLRSIWQPFANPNWLNSIGATAGHNEFDYPWQDFRNIRFELVAQRFIDAYRRRMFFHAPWQQPYMTMTNEVIATLWHPPSRAVTAPGLRRIPTAKAEPPPNLPM